MVKEADDGDFTKIPYMNEDLKEKYKMMNQAVYNARALVDAYDLISKYDLTDYTGAKEFVLHTLAVATDEQNNLSEKLHDQIWPKKD